MAENELYYAAYKDVLLARIAKSLGIPPELAVELYDSRRATVLGLRVGNAFATWPKEAPHGRCPHCRRILHEQTLCYWCWLDPRDPVSAENPPQRPIGATWELVDGSWRMKGGPLAFLDEDV